MEIEIRPLRPDDDRSSFLSGDVELDRFFRKYAGQNQFRLHFGVTTWRRPLAVSLAMSRLDPDQW